MFISLAKPPQGSITWILGKQGLLLKASRAYIAGLGTTGLLIASFFMLLTVGSTLVAFQGVPGQASNGDLSEIELRQQREAAANRERTLLAASRVPGDLREPAEGGATGDVLGQRAAGGAGVAGGGGQITETGSPAGADAVSPGLRAPSSPVLGGGNGHGAAPGGGSLESPTTPAQPGGGDTGAGTDSESGSGGGSDTGSDPGSDSGSGTGSGSNGDSNAGGSGGGGSTGSGDTGSGSGTGSGGDAGSGSGSGDSGSGSGGSGTGGSGTGSGGDGGGAGGVGDTVEDTTDTVGSVVGGVNPGLGDAVSEVGEVVGGLLGGSSAGD
jgi:hypothetical protein